MRMAKLSLVKFMLLCHLIQCFVFRIIDGGVFLVWDSGNKKKSQRDLARGAKIGVKDDVKILDYYRFVNFFPRGLFDEV